MGAFSLLERATPELLGWLHQHGQIRTLSPATPLIREGDPLKALVLLLNGELSVTTSSDSNPLEPLATLGAGGLVGEMSWLEQRPTVANVSASAECSVLEVGFAQLDHLQAEQPTLAAELQRLIACKLALQIQSQNAWIHRLSDKNSEDEPLRKVLMLFAALEERDVFRLAKLAQLQRLPPGGCLLQQGDPVTCLYVILSGEAEILLTLSETTRIVGSSRRGELLGEMSLLLEDQAGAAASVTSSSGMDLLAIDHVRLKGTLEQDPDLACRFYRGLACMLSQRSRDQLMSHRRALISREAEADDPDRLELAQLARISQSARQFDWLCRHFQAGASAGR